MSLNDFTLPGFANGSPANTCGSMKTSEAIRVTCGPSEEAGTLRSVGVALSTTAITRSTNDAEGCKT